MPRESYQKSRELGTTILLVMSGVLLSYYEHLGTFARARKVVLAVIFSRCT